MPAACAIAVMGKASVPGRTKTRLVPPLNAQEAARFNTAFLCDMVGNLYAAGRHASIAPYIAYAPAGSERFFREQIASTAGLIQATFPDFGDCLYGTVKSLLDSGHECACVINSDSPTLPTEILVDAARLLAAPGERVVLGPSADGGYYFLGLKQAHRRLFQEIDWSTASVCEQTRRRGWELGLEVILLDAWYDVDDVASLRMLYGDLLECAPSRITGRRAYAAPHTRAALLQMLTQGDFGARLGVR